MGCLVSPGASGPGLGGCLLVGSGPVPLHWCGESQLYSDYPSEFRVGIHGRPSGVPLAQFRAKSLHPGIVLSLVADAHRLPMTMLRRLDLEDGKGHQRRDHRNPMPEMVPRAFS